MKYDYQCQLTNDKLWQMMKLPAEAADPWLQQLSAYMKREVKLSSFFLAASHLVAALALFRLFNDPFQHANLVENDPFFSVTVFAADSELKAVHKRV